MASDLINIEYNSNWGSAKVGKLWIYCRDLLENGKRPLLPAFTFYSNWNGTVKDLAVMAGKILKYLKIKPIWILRVDFSYDLEAAGTFSVKSNNAKILIHNKYKNNPTACAAILAHEITHLVLNQRNCREEDNFENEKFTDFATVYFGLGILVLNGKYISHTADAVSILQTLFGLLALVFAGIGFLSNPVRKAENSFGYWETDQYYIIFTGYLLKNNLDWNNISQYIKKGTKYPGLSD